MHIEFNKKHKVSNITFILLESNKLPGNIKDILDKNILTKISDLTKFDFKGKLNQTAQTIVSHSNKNSNNICLVGIGKKHSNQDLKTLGYKIANLALEKKHTQISIITSALKKDQQIATLLQGLFHGNYKFTKYITNKKHKKITDLTIVDERADLKAFQNLVFETQKIGDTISYVKDLVNSPAIEITPANLGLEAKKIAKKSKKMKFTELGEKELNKLGLNLILEVGKGSGKEAKLIMIEYKNTPKNKKPLLIVGKGVTFDAGGLNIKPTNNIETMKTDMAGAATVLGLFNILTEIDLPIHVVGVIPSVENLLGDDAYKPGDILTAYNGKTIEITNTDAEGRLILADAFSYAIEKYQPEAIVDLATLTGACIMALGYTRTGLFTNNKSLLKQIKNASKKSGDQVWRLPLDKFHSDKVTGSISDYKNWTGGVQAGSSMAAAFLQKFVQKLPWAHLDIAGSSHLDMQIDHKSKGATGEPLHLMYEFIKNYS